jgi:hypothetical protein
VRYITINRISSFHDDSVPALKALRRLELLNLAGTNITDRAVIDISGIQTLTSLSLKDTSVTDAAVPLLCKMRNLEYLTISGTQISINGLRQLRACLPKCEIKKGTEDES